MPNDIKLQSKNGFPIDKNLRPLKVGGETTSIEISSHRGAGCRITGDLEVVGGDIKGEDATLDSLTTNSIISTDLTIDDSGDITLDAGATITLDAGDGNGIINFVDAGTTYGTISAHHSASHLQLYENEGASENDFLRISAWANGETDIYTEDSGGANAHLNFRVDGHINLNYNGEDDALAPCATGFTKVAETFSDDSIIGSGGTDDTHIDFRTSNKISLAVAGDITNLNLIFPAVSGNFLLLATYDGDHDVANWKVYESDASAADGDADVLWPGGSAPATTSSGADVFSFFWDATAEKCYGVGSLDFQ